MGDKIRAAKQEGAQKDLAEHGVGLKYPPQTRPPDLENQARFASLAADQAASSGELIDFAREHPADKDPGGAFLAGNADDFDAAVQHDEDAVAGVTPIKQDRARFGLALLPELLEVRDLRIVQLGKHRIDLFGSFRHGASAIPECLRLF